MKRPEINATGNITVNNLYLPDRGERDVNLIGLNTSLDDSDKHLTTSNNAIRMKYVIYLK
jgi:hypothetical protein